MRRFILLALVLTSSIFALAAQPQTMRLDYYHTGNSKQEMFSFDRAMIEPLPWPGGSNGNIDNSNLGKYIFEVLDRASGKLLYSRGFSSIYGEWETTAEANELNRTFSESFRFPAPELPVQIILKKRDAQNGWQQIWSVNLDPKSIFIDRSKPIQTAPTIALEKNGDPVNKVDLLILGDGYSRLERDKCEVDARRLRDFLFITEPFKHRRKDFNVWLICPPAPESGISRPSTGQYRRNPVGSSYDAFGSERYILTYDNKAFRDIAQNAPYEFVEILVNGKTYGGGGIFGLYSTVAANSLWAPYVFVHEFGHHFAGLADEYYTSDVAYIAPEHKIEPWETNVTALLDPKLLKWSALADASTPLPTPWNKQEFETYSRSIQQRRREIRKANKPESEMDALFLEESVRETKLLGDGKYASSVGAFEGANYEASGYYRSQANCIMFTRIDHFCKVCQNGIERMIDFYTK